MNLYRITRQNICRRGARMLLLICGLAAGIAAAVALLITVQAAQRELGNQIDEFGANVVIVPRGEGMELSYGGTRISRVSLNFKELSETDLPVIRDIPDGESINVISPKIVTAAGVDGREVLLVGMLPGKEFLMKPWFALAEYDGATPGERLPDPVHLQLPANSLLAGSAAAEALSLRSGDTVSLNGQDFRVAGILKKTGSTEDGLLYAKLSAVQSLLGRPGELSMIELSAYCNACPIEEIAAQLTEALPNGRVTALGQAALVRGETIDRFAVFAAILSGAALAAAALLVVTIMTASVNERTREIGILRAVGFRRSHVMQIIIMEVVTGGFFGGLAGFLLGSVTAILAGRFLPEIAGSLTWQPELLLPSVVASTFLAAAACIYPAFKAANLDPVEALRFI